MMANPYQNLMCRHLVYELFSMPSDVQMVDVSLLISGVMERLSALMAVMNSSVLGESANRYDLWPIFVWPLTYFCMTFDLQISDVMEQLIVLMVLTSSSVLGESVNRYDLWPISVWPLTYICMTFDLQISDVMGRLIVLVGAMNCSVLGESANRYGLWPIFSWPFTYICMTFDLYIWSLNDLYLNWKVAVSRHRFLLPGEMIIWELDLLFIFRWPLTFICMTFIFTWWAVVWGHIILWRARLTLP